MQMIQKELNPYRFLVIRGRSEDEVASKLGSLL